MSRNHSSIRSQRARKIAAQQIGMPCYRCGTPVLEGQMWDADHVINAVDGGDESAANIRISHRVCNRRAGGVEGGKRKAARRVAVQVHEDRSNKWWSVTASVTHISKLIASTYSRFSASSESQGTSERFFLTLSQYPYAFSSLFSLWVVA